MKGTAWLALSFGLAFAAWALAGGNSPASLAQQPSETNRKPACGCFVCAPPGWLETVEFGEKDCAGTLALDACPQYLAKLPAEKRAAACQKVREKFKKPLKDSCPAFASVCDQGAADPKPDCEPPGDGAPPPWFDPFGCQNLEDVKMTKADSQNGVTITFSACGQAIFTIPDYDPILAEAFSASWRMSYPKKVCCERLREAVRTGKPCNPLADINCDGNSNDSFAEQTSIENVPYLGAFYERAEGAKIDPFPAGMDIGHITPPGACPDCKKWVLTRGEFKCQPIPGNRQEATFWYQATWKCPSTGVEGHASTRLRRLKGQCKAG
jgi:hypothetical protein